jgi:LacI family transcriptional regulator
MQKVVTLKDISIATGVSLASVHRALYNKEGISGKLSQRIISKANELGYKTNYAAASLKRRPLNTAIVLPGEEGSGRFYYHYLWQACRKYHQEVIGLNMRLMEFAFSETENQVALLEKIYRTHRDDLDGILIVPLNRDDAMRIVIDKFIERGIQVVLVDNDIPGCGRLCCISPNDEAAGRLGAELLSLITHGPGKILVSAGSTTMSSHVYNLAGFMDYMTENKLPFQIHKVYGYDDLKKSYEEAKAFLKKNNDVAGFYALTARETISLCQAVIDSGYGGKIRGVGTDVFPESVRLLKDNIVQALLYAQPYEKAYQGLKILCESLIKKEKPARQLVSVPTGVVMKNNVSFFQEFVVNPLPHSP